MHNKHANDGLVTISVNLDDPNPEVGDKVGARLQKLGADFTALALAKGQDANDWFDNKLKAQALPAQQVYDRQGKLVKTFSSGGHEEEISQLVEKLLKQK